MSKHPENFIDYHASQFPASEMQSRARAYYEYMNRRRTVRAFSDRPIPDGVLEDCILAAGTAPSGAHKQPWLFAVVKDAAVKKQIREAAEKEERENYQRRFPESWLHDLQPFGTDASKPYIEIAPAIVIVFKENYRLVNDQKEKNYYVAESVGIAAGMFIAAVHNAGLCTLTHTPNPMAFLNEILKRPKNEVPMLLLPVGYPSENVQVPDLTRKPLAEIMKVY